MTPVKSLLSDSSSREKINYQCKASIYTQASMLKIPKWYQKHHLTTEVTTSSYCQVTTKLD